METSPSSKQIHLSICLTIVSCIKYKCSTYEYLYIYTFLYPRFYNCFTYTFIYIYIQTRTWYYVNQNFGSIYNPFSFGSEIILLLCESWVVGNEWCRSPMLLSIYLRKFKTDSWTIPKKNKKKQKWKDFLHKQVVEGLGYVPGVCWNFRWVFQCFTILTHLVGHQSCSTIWVISCGDSFGTRLSHTRISATKTLGASLLGDAPRLRLDFLVFPCWHWGITGYTMKKISSKYVYTPWKIKMEPTNHPFRKEIGLPNLHDWLCSMLIFRGVL